MVPLLVLGADDPDHPPFGGPAAPQERDREAAAQGAKIIPDCVSASTPSGGSVAGHPAQAGARRAGRGASRLRRA